MSSDALGPGARLGLIRMGTTGGWRGRQPVRDRMARMSDMEHLPHEEQLRRGCRPWPRRRLSHYVMSPDAARRASSTYRKTRPTALTTLQSGKRWALAGPPRGLSQQGGNRLRAGLAHRLREDGAVVTPTAVPGKDGELIQVVRHPESAECPRHVVLYDWEEGEEPDENQHDLRGPFEVLGEITARMHMPRAQLAAPGLLRAPDLGLRHQPGRAAALGPLARRDGSDLRKSRRPSSRPWT